MFWWGMCRARKYSANPNTKSNTVLKSQKRQRDDDRLQLVERSELDPRSRHAPARSFVVSVSVYGINEVQFITVLTGLCVCCWLCCAQNCDWASFLITCDLLTCTLTWCTRKMFEWCDPSWGDHVIICCWGDVKVWMWAIRPMPVTLWLFAVHGTLNSKN